MNHEKQLALMKEIKQYMEILAHSRLFHVLPLETLSELHWVLGTAVSMVQHMEQGED
jgi:hypothetical protein